MGEIVLTWDILDKIMHMVDDVLKSDEIVILSYPFQSISSQANRSHGVCRH
jgi:hypothetical protein